MQWTLHPRDLSRSYRPLVSEESEPETMIASVPGPTHPGTRVSQNVGIRTPPWESAISDTAMQAAAQESMLNMHARDASGQSSTASAPERSADMKEPIVRGST